MSQSDFSNLSNPEANRIYWDNTTDEYLKEILTIPAVKDMYVQMVAGVLRKAKLDPEKTILMDFACGNGEPMPPRYRGSWN